MAMDRWDPFREIVSLREAMDRLIQDSFVRPAGSLLQGSRGGVPLDVVEKDKSYEVHASLPGIKPEDVQIMVQGNTVTIRGESGATREQRDEKNWIVRERRAGSYFRSFTLPSEVDSSKATARYDNGVVVLELPKAEAAQPRRIQVNADTSTSQPTDVSVQSTGNGQSQQRQPSDQQVAAQPGSQSNDQALQASGESFAASDSPAWTPEQT